MDRDRLESDCPLAPGLYEHLVSDRISEALAELGDSSLFSTSEIEADEAHTAIGQYLGGVFTNVLAQFRGSKAGESQRRLANRILDILIDETEADSLNRSAIAEPLRRLQGIYRGPLQKTLERPDTPLARSALLTGTRLDPSLGLQLRKEMATADRVDVLCSFIKWSGLRLLLDELRHLTSEIDDTGPRLRVLTTSYMGATDPRAVEMLQQLPSTEVRVSYDTERTRLHAKAYIFHRESGFGSAYVGSANLSRVALSEGLEWTSKISQYELPHLWAKVVATFETYWNDEEFEPYTSESRARLRTAIRRERHQGADEEGTFAAFDLHPYPFQEEILEGLTAERAIQGKNRHLVVAATGTGKTVVAAFDYQRICHREGGSPSLLFVAHREEILKQALATFRGVLRNQNFGELLVGGREPERSEHLFCSIQSYNSQSLWRAESDQYEYVVVDEFHHAAAASYRRLLDHIRPRFLLGLTATPERTDELDVYHWFGGEASAEIRLPDAISRRLLCPFQYFGVSDCVDLDGLAWQRGGYRIDELERVYTGNDVRARLVVEKVSELVLDPLHARGLGFCVSVAHAEYMARFFSESGTPSLALSATSPKDERHSAQDRLRRREVNFVFVVDLYNEGVDIPEVDTILFLRPTESLTVFLQQLGRGLRLHEEKDCLTVLDFIGTHRREFRFASRFRALSTNPGRKLDREVRDAFPHLPPGCFVQLERVAEQRILTNISETLAYRRPRLIAELRNFARRIGRVPTIDEVLHDLDMTLDELLRRGLWSRLLADAGLIELCEMPDEQQLAKGFRRFAHIDDPGQIRFLLNHLRTPEAKTWLPEVAKRRLTMLHVTLWGSKGKKMRLAHAEERLQANPAAVADLQAILEHRLTHTRTRPPVVRPGVTGALAVHAEYTRDEILAGLGYWTMKKRPDVREGVVHIAESKLDVFFVTLNKTEDSYSPTTMYEDYVISPELVHWQSQSTTSADSKTGQRYIRHQEFGYSPLLFVREEKRLPSGLAAPYAFLGPASYVSHEGSRPISIVWRLGHPIPARLLRPIGRQTAG